MTRTTIKATLLALAALLLSSAQTATASPEVGSMVGLRGNARILRDEAALPASLKDPVLLKDLIETGRRSRAKVLFVDESMLTVGEDSRASIEEFVAGKDGGGASVFNLIDGKMRAVVGKNALEVHTPTVVAAARGTIIEFTVGRTADGRAYTIVVCLEGRVTVTNIDAKVEGRVSVGERETVTVFEGEPPPPPSPAPRPAGFGSEGGGGEGEAPEEGGEEYGQARLTEEIVTPLSRFLPPIAQEPPVETTPVNIGVTFPQ